MYSRFQAQDSIFHKQKYPGSEIPRAKIYRIPKSGFPFTWDDIHWFSILEESPSQWTWCTCSASGIRWSECYVLIGDPSGQEKSSLGNIIKPLFPFFVDPFFFRVGPLMATQMKKKKHSKTKQYKKLNRNEQNNSKINKTKSEPKTNNQTKTNPYENNNINKQHQRKNKQTNNNNNKNPR